YRFTLAIRQYLLDSEIRVLFHLLIVWSEKRRAPLAAPLGAYYKKTHGAARGGPNISKCFS
ncbi:TPA: hypothetical protein ACG31X_004786, partial [Escherichia coli]